jgi:hypothetical protein
MVIISVCAIEETPDGLSEFSPKTREYNYHIAFSKEANYVYRCAQATRTTAYTAKNAEPAV